MAETAASAEPPQASLVEDNLPPLELPDDVHMVVLGDSWADGNGVPRQQTLGAVLANRMGGYRLVDLGLGAGYLRATKRELLHGARLANEPVHPAVDLFLVQGSFKTRRPRAARLRNAVQRASRARVQDRQGTLPQRRHPCSWPAVPHQGRPSGEVVKMDDWLPSSTREMGAYCISPAQEQ